MLNDVRNERASDHCVYTLGVNLARWNSIAFGEQTYRWGQSHSRRLQPQQFGSH